MVWLQSLYSFLVFEFPSSYYCNFLLSDSWWVVDFNLFSVPTLHCITVDCRLNKACADRSKFKQCNFISWCHSNACSYQILLCISWVWYNLIWSVNFSLYGAINDFWKTVKYPWQQRNNESLLPAVKGTIFLISTILLPASFLKGIVSFDSYASWSYRLVEIVS